MIICLVGSFPNAYAAVKYIHIIEIYFFCVHSPFFCVDDVIEVMRVASSYCVASDEYYFMKLVFHLVVLFVFMLSLSGCLTPI